MNKKQKCNLANHENYDIVIICLDKSCKEKKLGCAKCICEKHAQHTKACVFINDILQENNNLSTINIKITD